MLYEETFLDNADYQKYQMYRSLKTIDNFGFTINDLSVQMQVSYQQAYNIFRELLADIEEMTGHANKAAKKRVMSQDNFPVSVDEYRLFLLENSIQFQFVDYLVQSTSLSVDKFCQDRFISRSTLTRKTMPLRKLLADYDIKISFTQPGLVGSEQKIRLFLFIFYWLGYHGVRWPITAIHPQQLNLAYSKLPTRKSSPIAALQEVLFWGICRLRIVRGHTITSWPEYDDIFGSVEAMNTPIYTKEMFPKLSPETLASESKFFHYQQNRQLRFSTSQDSWLELYANVVSTDNPVHEYINAITDYLEQFWRQDAPVAFGDNVVLIANMMRTVMSYYMLGGDYAKMADFFDSKRDFYPHSELYASLLAFNEELPDIPSFSAFKRSVVPMTLTLTYMLTPYLQNFTWPQIVKCRILLEHGDVNAYRVVKFLRNMSFVRIQGDSDDVDEADLIITNIDDEPLFRDVDATRQTVVTWHADATDNDYFNLYLLVKRIFLKILGMGDVEYTRV
ncbi:helix-turn-helix domain-containing protein [Lacticaseibacillus hulanensis]|uniref:helix-turn-helix domain-containing protein n=1 Tax=Lacticaseibacillus hulanensis TaxID=2493111 RepID=UPI0013E2D172|nr:helix-turn-helix domain-containing protein [Lacticaseibacillus hulanensis]